MYLIFVRMVFENVREQLVGAITGMGAPERVTNGAVDDNFRATCLQ